ALGIAGEWIVGGGPDDVDPLRVDTEADQLARLRAGVGEDRVGGPVDLEPGEVAVAGPLGVVVRSQDEGETAAARDLEGGQGQELTTYPVVVDQDVLRPQHALHQGADLGGDPLRS